ncbi:MAG: SpoIID/LytB domain-containing protein, partial [Candidatus Paceibacterota bacterium]
NAGQSAEEILSAYYANIEIKKDYSTDITINVDGLGSYNIEDYVKRIYEMPSSWPMEALKSQAVAARSYALSYTNNGASSICATQQCQVAKAEEKGGRWNEAVDATRGWVMLNNGSPITAWYASTAGGYTFQNNDVWGGSHRPWTRRMQDGSGSYGNFQDVINNAYDKDSPCMYAAQGWRNEYAKSAWLKNEEVADIVNVLMLAKADSGVQVHLSQTDKPNPDGQETWDASRVKQELKNRGIAPYNSISNISMGADFGIGRTTNVSVSGDVGTQSFSGDEFKNFLNLRAPANIQIVGPLFNVERR